MERVRAVAVAALLAFAAPAAAESPQDFVQDAIADDLSDIRLATLAERQASTAAVRDFATMLAANHGAAMVEAQQVARALQVTPPDSPDADADAAYERLSKLSGKDFDRAFVDLVVEDHKAAIAVFEAEAVSDHGATAELAAKQVATLKQHLEVAEALQRQYSQP